MNNIKGNPNVIANGLSSINQKLASASQSAIKNALSSSGFATSPAKNLPNFNPAQASSIPTNIKNMSIEDLLVVALGENAEVARGELDDMKGRIDENNARRQTMRDLRAAVRNGDETEAKAILNANDWIKDLGVTSIPNLSKDADRAGLEDTLDDAMQELNDINSNVLFKLQVIATRVTQAEQAMSSVFKKFSDAASAIINNI